MRSHYIHVGLFTLQMINIEQVRVDKMRVDRHSGSNSTNMYISCCSMLVTYRFNISLSTLPLPCHSGLIVPGEIRVVGNINYE